MNKNQHFHGRAHYRWHIRGKKYPQFTDLGRYVIDCGRHRHFDFERAREYINSHYAASSTLGGCTAFATRTRTGDVLIGRNLDLTVSQMPCFITHLHYGRYETINFTYDEISTNRLRYDELLREGWIDPDYYNALPMFASDSMNSEGLFIEYNMRGYEDAFFCSGTNPGRTRVCTVSLPFLVASHCATVPEALRYMREQLDLYTLLDETIVSGWNLCCVIGDAKGHYGLIEIANNEIKYLPQQHGQGNYYIYPAYNAISRGQSGYGRLQYGLERIDTIQNEQQMAQLMEDVMWRNEILMIPYAYRDRRGHIHFCADPEHRIPTLDWRSDNVGHLPVNAEGKYVDVDDCTPEALLVRKFKHGYERYLAGSRSEADCECYENYMTYLNRCDLVWVQTDENFEDLQRGLIRHYTENGAFEKLRLYYSGEETPLREDANIFTTSLSFSVNCTRKRLTVKFWENPTTVMFWQW